MVGERVGRLIALATMPPPSPPPFYRVGGIGTEGGDDIFGWKRGERGDGWSGRIKPSFR